jgi:hypothetical protein
MVIELKPEQQHIIDLAIQSGAYQTTDDEPRFTLSEAQAELRALGKSK